MGPEAGAAPPTLWPEQLSAFLLHLLFFISSSTSPTPVAPLQGAAFRRRGSRWGGQVGASISSLAAFPLGVESALEKAGLRGRWRGMRCALDSLPSRTPEPRKLGLQALAADSPGRGGRGRRGGRGGSGELGGRQGRERAEGPFCVVFARWWGACCFQVSSNNKAHLLLQVH